MYVVVDPRASVAESYVSGFSREGFSSLGFGHGEFKEWLQSASDQDLGAVQGFLLGDFETRNSYPEMIRTHSRAPVIALEDIKSLSQTLELYEPVAEWPQTAGMERSADGWDVAQPSRRAAGLS